MSETHDCGGDAAAYVLGALEPAEAQQFEAHLSGCAVCRDEVDALSAVTQALPLAAPQFRAPKRVERNVMREVRRDLRRQHNRSQPAWLAAFAVSRTRFVTRIASLAVVAAVVVKFTLLSGGGTITLIDAQLAHVSGSAQVRIQNDHADLVVRHFTRSGKGEVYEVWLQRGQSAPVPARVLFAVGTDGSADVSLPESVKDVRAILVTSEPDGGSPAPTHSPVIIARLD